MRINKMSLDIEMDNAAFEPNKWIEVSRILRVIARDLDNLHLPNIVYDINGNTVGKIVYDFKREKKPS